MKILIVDDDNAVRASLSVLLRRAGYEPCAVASPSEAMAEVRRWRPDAVLLDMNFSLSTSGIEGITLLKQVKLFHPDVPVILMTAWGTIPLAVEGIKAGAADFISKPWDNRRLLESLAAAIELAAGGNVASEGDFDRSMIIGRDPGLMEVLDTVRRVAPTMASVLITGENGTGKELVAESIHRNSPRRDAPFVKVNLGGVSRSLFESEMFGYRKGAFTGAVADRAGRFEVADKGTIFLDEMGELDMSCQVKMLRVLQEHTFERLGDSTPRKVDVRVVCATNAPLGAMVADGSFREDLFYRISLITVTLPPLRERRGDIPELVRHFASAIARANSMAVPEVSADAMEYLASLPWPGNIRQLRNLVERTMIVTGRDRLDASDFSGQNHGDAPGDIPATIGDMERVAIVKALAVHGDNISAAARELGLSRQALYRRMDKYGIRI